MPEQEEDSEEADRVLPRRPRRIHHHRQRKHRRENNRLRRLDRKLPIYHVDRDGTEIFVPASSDLITEIGPEEALRGNESAHRAILTKTSTIMEEYDDDKAVDTMLKALSSKENVQYDDVCQVLDTIFDYCEEAASLR